MITVPRFVIATSPCESQDPFSGVWTPFGILETQKPHRASQGLISIFARDSGPPSSTQSSKVVPQDCESLVVVHDRCVRNETSRAPTWKAISAVAHTRSCHSPVAAAKRRMSNTLQSASARLPTAYLARLLILNGLYPRSYPRIGQAD